MSHQIIEVCFDHEINQENDNEKLETMNNAIQILFGEKVEIDWRDEQTVWIHNTAVQIDTLTTLFPTV